LLYKGESDKMWISHMIKTDQWFVTPQIRLTLHFVVSPFISAFRLEYSLEVPIEIH